MNKWTGFDVENAKYIGEFEIGMTDLDADHVLSVVRTETHFVGGGVCNTGLLQSCSYEIDPDFSDDENLQEFISDIMAVQYNGRHFATDRFTCNARLVDYEAVDCMPMLLELIAAGYEYPDANERICNQYGCNSEELDQEYDLHCKNTQSVE